MPVFNPVQVNIAKTSSLLQGDGNGGAAANTLTGVIYANGGSAPTATTGGQVATLLSGQAINPTSIGATTPGTGAFTTLNVSGQGTFAIPVSVKGIYITSATTGISDASNSQTFLQTGAHPILQGQNSSAPIPRAVPPTSFSNRWEPRPHGLGSPEDGPWAWRLAAIQARAKSQ